MSQIHHRSLRRVAVLSFVALAGTSQVSPVRAESATVTGAGALSSAPCCRLDLQIVIPRILRFRVGITGGTVDQVTFTVSAANAFDGTPIAGTGGSTALPTLNAGSVTNRTSTWTYAYSNPGTLLEAGTYGTGGLGGGRVTYTATTP